MPSPTESQIDLGARLRRLRLQAGLTMEDVARHLLWSPTKVSRIERGARGASLRDVRDLCQIYGVDDPGPWMDLARLGRADSDVSADRLRLESETVDKGRLSSMLLADLQRLAVSLGIQGTGRMRKGQLIEAIKARTVGGEPMPPAATSSPDLHAEPGRPSARYIEIGEDLLRQIQSGERRPGEQLPTEAELRDLYDASRNSVRDAIKWLTIRAFVVSRPGRGTFVAETLPSEILPNSSITPAPAPRDSSRRGSPMYRHIAEDLMRQIESGELPLGTRLPTELELREKYNASRNSARDAIKWLTNLGAVETRPGQGTFVIELLTPLTPETIPGRSARAGSVGVERPSRMAPGLLDAEIDEGDRVRLDERTRKTRADQAENEARRALTRRAFDDATVLLQKALTLDPGRAERLESELNFFSLQSDDSPS